MDIVQRVILILLLLFSVSARAETIPATEIWSVDYGSPAQSVPTMQEVCQIFTDRYATVYGWAPATVSRCETFSGNPGAAAVWFKDKDGIQRGSYRAGTRYYHCPNGGSLSGTSCINVPECVLPQVRQSDGSCGVPPPPECEPGCNGACGSTKRFLNFRTRACIDQCIYKLGMGIGIQTSDGSWYYGHDVRDNTGASCTPDMDNSLPDPQPCPECECAKQGKSWASMNGTTVCLNPGTPGSQPVTKQDPPVVKEETPAPTPENPNPEPVQTETPAPIITITPNPAGGSPDITETVTNPDGSTTSTTQTQPSYCQKNPTASVCKQADEEAKKGSWSGSCGAFQCEGDAVNCAIARKIHQDRCDDMDDMQQFENAASLGKKLLNGEHEADVTAFLNGEGDGNKTINVGGLVSENGAYQFTAQCLSDIQFTIGGHAITVPISKVCPYFEMIGLFLLAAAYLAALRIVEVV